MGVLHPRVLGVGGALRSLLSGYLDT